MAGLCAAVVSNPVWVLNTREKVKQTQLKGLFASLRDLIKEDGLSGLMAGLGPAIVLVLNPSIQFAVYERLKSIALARKQLRLGKDASHPDALPPRIYDGVSPGPTLSSPESFLLGAVSKVAALIATYPYQVVKSRAHAARRPDEHRDGTFRCLLRIAQREGMAGLYRGFFSKVFASGLTAALMFVTYEKILGQLINANNMLRKWASDDTLLQPPRGDRDYPKHMRPKTKLP
eukprot:GHVN01056248.1.p2 GENE.GHVN01056248.1~~GHVN01056248.1.p2  ORF type:complete len:232 (-),score=25.40 GHVN01056248.1:1543-2238(-)